MGSIIQDVMIKFQGDTTGLANATSAARKEMSAFYKRMADYTPKEQRDSFREEGSRYSKIVQDQRAKVVKLMNDTNAALVAGGKVTTATVNKIRREYAILQDIPNRLKSILPRAAFTPAGVLTEQSQVLMKSMTSRKLGGLKEEIAAIEKKAYAISLSEAQKYEKEKQDKLRSIRLKSVKNQLADKLVENQKLEATKNKLGEQSDVETTRMILAERKYNEQKKKQRADRKKERQKEAEEEEKETRKLGLTQISAQKEFTNKQNKEANNRTKAAIKAELAERKLAVMQMAAYKEDAVRFPKQTMFGGIQEWFSKGAGKIATTIASFYSLYQVWRLCAQAAKFLFNESIQLQTSFARINALALVSGKNYTGLRNAIFSLGTAHGFLATEVTQAIKPLVQMGKTQEEIATLTKKAMQVANLTGESLSNIISNSIASMTNFDMTIKEQTVLMDYWATLTSHYAITIGQLTKGFEQGGETFKEFGFNAKQVSAIMAVLMEQEQGSLPGVVRFLRLIMEQLPKAEVAAAIYKNIGVTTLDASGAQRDTWQVLAEMGKSWQTLSAAQRTNFRNSISNKSAMEALYGAMNDWAKIQKAFNLDVKEGSSVLDKQSKLIEDTVQNRWVALKNVWIDIASGKAEGLIGFLSRTLSALSNISQELSKPGWGKFWDILSSGQPLEQAIESRGKWFDWMLPEGMQQTLAKNKYGYGASGSWADIPTTVVPKEVVGGYNKDSKATTDAMDAANKAAQKARDLANTGYAEWKKHQDKIQATNENNFKIATEQYKLEQGYQVGITKELQDELTARRELQDTYEATSTNLTELIAKQKELKAAIALPNIGPETDILKTQLEEVEKNISAGNLKLAETKTALELQETVVRKIGETYRNMILDTMVEIIEKTQNWLDLNYKLRDLLSNIGNDVLRKVLDRITGGFVDKLGSLGSLATNQKGSSTANIAGLGAVGVASAAGGYAYVKGKGWVPAKGTGVPGGLGFSDYAGAGMMGAAIGSNRGTKGMVGGAIGSMVGMGAGFAIGGPIGAQIGAMAGGWLGSLFGKPKKDETKAEETAKTWTSIPSKIDVTNNELQVVNRNLIALKEKMEPYPMPSSYYFSARGNSGQGTGAGQWGNVTVNVNGSGDPQATANAVASIFSMNSLQGAQ